ncbi:hypothetical protein N8148_03070 [Gammaproteobacteria bacterium]|nr:hypothetical protein [Gammaproteobacteria bacterium]
MKKKQYVNDVNLHHRRPQAQTKKKDQVAPILVDKRRHKAWHDLFHGKMSVEDIIEDINNFWIDDRYVIKYEKKETKDPNQKELPFR